MNLTDDLIEYLLCFKRFYLLGKKNLKFLIKITSFKIKGNKKGKCYKLVINDVLDAVAVDLCS